MNWCSLCGFRDWERFGFAVYRAGAAEHQCAATTRVISDSGVCRRRSHPSSAKDRRRIHHRLKSGKVNYSFDRFVRGVGFGEQPPEQRGIADIAANQLKLFISTSTPTSCYSLKGHWRTVGKSSKTSKLCPASSNTTQVWLPMKPAPPVISRRAIFELRPLSLFREEPNRQRDFPGG